MKHSSSDIFLLLTSLKETYVSKAAIKKLFHSCDNFPDLFFCELKKTSFEGNLEEVKKSISSLNLNEIKEALNKKNINFIAYCDKEYPPKLKEISDSPFGLFCKGDIGLLKDLKTVSIVGTRSATNYGKNITKKLSMFFAEQNMAVISGLAAGIDTCAHEGALERGKTIAVLGTGIDIVFPAGNRDLYNQIVNNGLVLSEYSPGTEGAPWNFPQRNRIISALSDAVIVVEGDLQSGALITARFAIRQGKPLFAIPGPVDSQMSNGPNILIKSGVAELLTSAQDVLEKIGGEKQTQLNFNTGKSIEGLSNSQKNIYDSLSSTPKNFDSVLLETNLDVRELTKNLSLMELKGVIEKTSDGGYVRC